MNWMTSGRHRALCSKRGKKRGEMRFPLHVQQREQARLRRHPLVQQSEAESREKRAAADGTPWYIRTIKSEHESHDVQMLEMARANAKGTQEKSGIDDRNMAVDRSETLAQPPSDDLQVQAKSAGKPLKSIAARRCVFTPVKAARSRKAAAPTNARLAVKRPSSPPRKDLLFFDQGEAIQTAENEPNERNKEIPQPRSSQRTSERDQSALNRSDSNPTFDQDLVPELEESSLYRPFYMGSPSSSLASSDSQTFRALSIQEVQVRPMQELVVARSHPPSLEAQGRSPLASSSSTFSQRTVLFAEMIESSARQTQASDRVHAEMRTSFSTAVDQQSTWCDPASRHTMSGVKPSDLVIRSYELTEDDDEVNRIYSSANSETRSQSSPALLPPLGWQLSLATKPQLSRQDSHHSSPSVHDFVAVNMQRDASNVWKPARRTESILASIASCQEVVQDGDEMKYLKQRLHEELGVTIYLSTLLACYRIEEQIGSE